MKHFLTLLNLGTLGIGSYMTFEYAGNALPPTLSGIAFLCIGVYQLLSCRCK